MGAADLRGAPAVSRPLCAGTRRRQRERDQEQAHPAAARAATRCGLATSLGRCVRRQGGRAASASGPRGGSSVEPGSGERRRDSVGAAAAPAIVRAQVGVGRDAGGCAPRIHVGRAGVRGEDDSGPARKGARACPSRRAVGARPAALPRRGAAARVRRDRQAHRALLTWRRNARKLGVVIATVAKGC